ncbi:H4MPT-linked C1 transfer pathway protein [Methanothermobacter marburgensis]|uniref:Predicted transcriptional regulator n=1 Tax=Methanothermobacter marburgensis (strain ATCC BAA-927 / DSM 2133 / JCM 14651 / NBRC 100331 / OCM 82 / Marburg) TaxID=79929 RepID=D9PX72_METTM|nr:hydantoinase/oxoprolinase family protein [Methanothermobacter marburgensis]ADL58820.1 predicted transcriptional regulator [Methanothermobacter marburgensis str. Marburg]WBF10723.1 H4MPT-linked C1 transfer pathway protein [Methanothermobacter marburgensis]
MKIVGFDIGGANTDMALIEFGADGEMKKVRVDFRYLPMWLKHDELSETLIELTGDDLDDLDGVGVCMTAELVDAYPSKAEGVIDIVESVQSAFDVPVAYVSLSGMVDASEAVRDPMDVAAANWVATSQIASAMSSDCIMVDVGSTTTDIIPVKDGFEAARGRNDLERLSTGELVYTGTLRTNVATIVDRVPLHDKWFRVSSELFAITADVHRVLGNIRESDYTCSTPDGSGRSIEDCMLRIARVLCADLELLEPEDILEVSEYIYHQQILKIAEGIAEVSERENLDEVIATGLGMNVLAKRAAEILDLKCRTMDEFLTEEECVVAPAVGTALLMEDYLQNR